MKFYAKFNHANFANTWRVFVFSSRRARDEFVDAMDRHWDGQNAWKAAPVKKSEIGRTIGYEYNPYYPRALVISNAWETPFDGDEHAVIGEVIIDYPDAGERLF